ncbi:RHS repeat-associated core domain-containing protein [Actinomadura violacea]|uniref:Uncharacterized protein n=1 Tax=Actinomadura violacea TaxID=2819934 RepID=A0ABS3RU77_9ACTN|nr:RHS repeat-associated core domain-containing protein [Actinomadura violacea]MBO2460309.1 hypothetical protein [Actinomadura violacea]
MTALALFAPLLAAIEFLSDDPWSPHALSALAVRGVHKIKPSPQQRTQKVKTYAAGKISWPDAHQSIATLDSSQALGTGRGHPRQVKAKGTPVWVQPTLAKDGRYHGPSQIKVTMASHATATKAHVNGTMFAVAPTAPVAATGAGGQGSVRVGVDYHDFAHAYGGNFGSRLRLTQLPACALSTPERPQCQTQTPVAGVGNNVTGEQVYAQPTALSSGPMVLAASSVGGPADSGDGGSPAGSYQATTLKPSGSWSGGGSSGSFNYSYPIQVPPAASALAPTVALSYDSASIDGQTVATQAQASWAGDGWGTPQSFIEQSFKPCSDSPEGSKAPQSTADQCYDGQILTLSLNGSSTALVWDAGKKTYTPADDNGEVVKRVTNSGNGSGTHDTDYWTVTDRDGTVYQFGRNHLPGWASGKPATNSVDTEPVFSAHSGDPCYNATWASSWCTMAYRWNLDYVTDVHSNAMAYYYKQDTNAYVRNMASGLTEAPNANQTYVRDSHLDHIDYGFTDGAAYSVNGGHAPNQVIFQTDGRCSQGGTCPALTKDTAKNWPDVPYDLNCTVGVKCLVASTSFWSTVRLTGIKTQQYNGTSYAPVDSWAIKQTMPATGDGTASTLWLSSITHTGSDTTAGGDAVTLPPVTFTPTTQTLPNRLDTSHDGLPPLLRERIGTIVTETGSKIAVNYTQANPCQAGNKPTPASNTTTCYPVYWTPVGDTSQYLDWFNKYQVSAVAQSDPTGHAPELYTSYKYLGGGAWHYDDNESVKAKYRTYGQWRGFGDVQTFTGTGTDAQTEEEATYYRGMSDNGPGPFTSSDQVNLKDSQGGVHEDLDQLAGETLESTGYNYAGGKSTGSTINSYWVSDPVASRSRTGLPALTANVSGQVEEWTSQALSTPTGSTTWRKTETDTTYGSDPSKPAFGLPLVAYAHGDLTRSDQRQCSITTYAPANTGNNVSALPAEVEVDGVACEGSSPDGASAPTSGQTNALTAPTGVTTEDLVSDQRTFYDNPAMAASLSQQANPTWPQGTPTKGDISVVQVAESGTRGAFTYRTKSAATYDKYGRPDNAYDGLGRHTQTTYTASPGGLPTGASVTNPLGQVSSAALDPLRGLTISTTDPNTSAVNTANSTNNTTTTVHYDGLGRIIAQWGNERPTSAPANATFSYQVSNTDPTVVTTQVMNEAQGHNTSTLIYDALMRPRQSQAPTPAGGRLVTDTFYDSRGWTTKTNNGWWDDGTTPGATLVGVADSEIANQTVNAFDGAGRNVLAISYDNTNGNDNHVKSQTATVYDQSTGSSGGNKTITVPLDGNGTPFAGGGAKATVTDALGRTVETDDYTTLPTVKVAISGGAPITTVSATGGTVQPTTFTISKAGRQTDVKDSTGHDWSSTKNLLGQITSKDDPDAGSSTIIYDAVGNIAQTTDARHKTISFTYDALNRKTGEYDAATTDQHDFGTSGANQLASWAYDNSNNAVTGIARAIGKLTTTASYVGGNAYTSQITGFNVFGEPLGTTITIPTSEGALGGTYTFRERYATNTGLPIQDIFPAAPQSALPAENVTHGYTGSLWLPTSLAGAAHYADKTDYTAYGQVSQEEIGANTGDHAFLTNAYDAHTGALTDSNIVNTAVSNTPIDETGYTYDPAGNPTKQTEVRQGAQSETQCFGYDTQDRLIQAWTATDGCKNDPSTGDTSTIGDGVAGGTYWTTWTFNALGQRKAQIQHNLTGGADHTTTYAYDGNSASQPHTLTGTTTTGGTSDATTSYTYDADGNTATRTTPDQGQQALTWDDTGKLTAVTGESGGSSYIYTADGGLLLQKDPGKTTLYLPGEQLALDTQAGTITGTRYYALPGGGQAIRTGGTYTFQASDQHGTATLTLDSTLTTPTWRQQDPYGNPRGTTPAVWPDNRGFLGQPNDTSTGLTSLGARWYDPSVGAFESLDPLFEATDTQQQNGYTYASSNPITGSDPSGLHTDGCEVNHDCSIQKIQHPDWPTGSQRCNSYCGDTNVHGGAKNTASGRRQNELGQAALRYLELLEAAARKRLLQSKITAQLAKITALKKRISFYNCNDMTDASPSKAAGCGGLRLSDDDLQGVISAFEALSELAGQLTGNPYTDELEPEAEAAVEEEKAILGKVHLSDGNIGEIESDLGQAQKVLQALRDAAGCMSFVGPTRVKMADGSEKAINKIKVGDEIADALPGTSPGERDQVHTVTAIHVTYTDRHYTDVTIATPNGPRAIKGTNNHLYWDATTRAWTRADQLHAGHRLQSGSGATVRILKVRDHNDRAVTYNLTVDGLHTYFVAAAGGSSVLVHNNVGCDGPLVLGIGKHSDALAVKVGGHTFNGPEYAEIIGQVGGKPYAQWMANVTGSLKANSRVAVALDGFDGDDPSGKFMAAYKAGRGNDWRATEWEMGQIGSMVQRGYLDWENVTFYEGGKVVDIPKPEGW